MKWYSGNILTTKTPFAVHWASSRVLWTALYAVFRTKKEKSTRCGNFTPTPPYTLKVACLNFGMWGRVLDIINHTKFQLDRFRGFGARGGRKWLSPIDWMYRPYNSVRTNVLHCDEKQWLQVTCTPEDRVILQSLWNTTMMISWQLREHK